MTEREKGYILSRVIRYIAHNLNGELAVIMGRAEFGLMKPTESQKHLRKILHSADKQAGLVRDLQGLAQLLERNGKNPVLAEEETKRILRHINSVDSIGFGFQ